MGVDYEPPLLAHHTLNLTSPQVMNDYWSDYYLKGKLYDVNGKTEVMGLISWASKIDPSLAPEGKHVLTHMGLAPYNLAGDDWDRLKERYIDEAIATIERNIIPDLSKHVVFRDMATPLDLERMLLHPAGAVYGIQTDISHMAVFRPANRSKAIRNLYLAGASTHPGGGIPGVLAGGIITGGLVTRDNA
jgi:phytoene desaturase